MFFTTEQLTQYRLHWCQRVESLVLFWGAAEFP